MLTDKEKELLDLTRDVFNLWLDLPVEHPSEREDFCTKLHDIQRMIMCRPTRRDMKENNSK